VGIGSCFTFTLPVGDKFLENSQMVERTTNLDEKIASISGEVLNFNDKAISTIDNRDNGPIVLIVEDNDDLRYYLSCELHSLYKVVEAANGQEGFDKAIETIPDIIISDVMMPKMNGIELCHKLKTDERTSHIPVIILTARPLDEHKIEGYETGADDYITKPFGIDVLMARIKNLIDSRAKLRGLFGNVQNFNPKRMAVNPVDELFLSKAINTINENISDYDFGPTEFANKLGLSRSQLYRKINALTNKSVSEFMNTIRLNKSAEMLLENKYTISEVAFAVGFTEQSNFTRSFNKQFGQSPTSFISANKVKGI
jgi:DNA-binding response OmpR family regulator